MGMLVYDGDCGFCQRSLGWARRLGATCPAEPWQALDLTALGLSEQEVIEAAWYVEGTRRWRGHEAIAQTLQTSRYGAVRVLGRVVGSRALRPVGARVYTWVADHRYRLPGASDACALPPHR